MLGPDSQAYKMIIPVAKYLQRGIVLSIDPSIGSKSSMPGFALYKESSLWLSGIIQLNPADEDWTRLQQLSDWVRHTYKTYQPDVLVYEDIPAQHHGPGGQAGSHSKLIKAVGAILSVRGPQHFVGIMPTSWKKMVRSSYVKSDEADAIEMGWVVISESRRIAEIEARKKSKETKNKGR